MSRTDDMNWSAGREERIQERKDLTKKSFGDWLQQPMVKLGLAAAEKGDGQALHTLLEAAFNAGSHHGQGAIAMDMLEAIIKNEREQKLKAMRTAANPPSMS